ncbi:MAG TPA: HXXEE domain-containing protein [Paludibacter sp.]|nr:HXXEE domain-containing protein [Paludibacter sp.]
MSGLNYKKHLLVTGFLFTLHNMEEAFGFSRFIYPTQLPAYLPQPLSMIWAIGLITLLAWGFILVANIQYNENFRKDLLTIFATVFLVNAIFPHIAGTLFLHRYFPAVITSVILFLPYSIWLLPKLYKLYGKPIKFFGVATGGVFAGGIIALCLQLLTYMATR